ncbi:metalloprotease [Candidatus Woesearchaeota archaeon]|nr:metalloprotease [Candidatus Woesearchaeota archaeon]
MRFSTDEIRDLLRAWFLLSIAFAILFTGFSFDIRFLIAVIISAFTAGIGFLLHELAHKYVAQKYGCHAEFHAFDQMLWIAVFLSFFGFIFAAPGAVFISGRITPRKNGHISIAGPLTNVIIGLIFLILFALINAPLIKSIAGMGMHINFLLAAFNMIPFFGLDGAKVLHWNRTIYTITLVSTILLYLGAGPIMALFN